nr:phage portal protein [Lacrimispora defluvii]
MSFKVGYLCGEPIQYVSRNGKDETVTAINTLNEMMFSEDKSTQDQEIVEWQMICGTSFRIVLPDDSGEEDEAPFEMYTLDPRDSFVVYSNEIGRKPLMGVKFCINENGVGRTYTVYTKNHYWKIEDTNILESKPHALGMIPIFEYPANNARLGAFEIVLPLLDAINDVASNRMDGLEQFIQAFLVRAMTIQSMPRLRRTSLRLMVRCSSFLAGTLRIHTSTQVLSAKSSSRKLSSN